MRAKITAHCRERRPYPIGASMTTLLRRPVAPSLPRTLLVAALSVLLATMLVPLALRPSPVAAAGDLKVAIIVGPSGAVTDEYRAIADRAAVEAALWTTRVVKVYNPNATWKAAREALQGASVVIYLGHGNGWPSKYRSTPWAYSQNGLGLNPVAGGDDDAHQYFGEFYLAKQVRLAPNAVVILHRLCYASGNSEPGVPEGTPEVARQRVDNYAAGWLKAGARAVVADLRQTPDYYLHELFTSRAGIETIWKNAPRAYGGHLTSFPSARSSGYVAHMDPRTDTSGFSRSLVTLPGFTATEVRFGQSRARPARPGGTGTSGRSKSPGPTTKPEPSPAASPDPTPAPTPSPNLTERGFRFAAPAFKAPPAAGSTLSITVDLTRPRPSKGSAATLPKGLALAVRWDPLALDAVPPPSDSRPADPAADPSPDPLVAPEVLGEVVLTEPVRVYPKRLVSKLAVPGAPGLYRLSVTLTGEDGAPLPHGAEPLIPSELVRVEPALSASVRAPLYLQIDAGASLDLPVTVTNVGSRTWSADGGASAGRDTTGTVPPVDAPTLVVHWIDLWSGASVPAVSVTLKPLAPGKTVALHASVRAPGTAGQYAALLDVVDPVLGSLLAAGSYAAIVRITVAPAPPGPASPLPAPPGAAPPPF